MDGKHAKTLLCVLAFLAVFAHSVIPHEHNCSGGAESHIHHFGNCEAIGTFIVKDTGLPSGTDDLFPEATDIQNILCEYRYCPIVTPFEQDRSDHFRNHGQPDAAPKASRGPPAA